MVNGLRRSGLLEPYQHSLFVRDAHEGGWHTPPETPEQSHHELFYQFEDILLGCVGHLEVQLVKFPGRTVGAGILVAEAWRDLEITLEA